MQPDLATYLAREPFVVLDGAMATELERRGHDLRDPLWSARVLLEAPDDIRAVHAAYFAAGADVAITASYQATFEGFARRGLSHSQAAALLRRSVTLACEARDAAWQPGDQRLRPLVAASVGPYGAYLANGAEYTGQYDLDEDGLVAFHRERVAVLLAAGCDLLACETIPSLAEARALVRLLHAFPDARAWVSFSCRDGAHTCHGEVFAECAAEIGAAPQIVAVGVNCTAPQYVADLIGAARRATTTPIVVYPNSGEHYHAATQRWNGCATGDYGAQARAWYEAGARLIGGCCRTSPDDIREVAAVRATLSEMRHLPE